MQRTLDILSQVSSPTRGQKYARSLQTRNEANLAGLERGEALSNATEKSACSLTVQAATSQSNTSQVEVDVRARSFAMRLPVWDDPGG